MKTWFVALLLLLAGCHAAPPPVDTTEAQAELKTYFFEAARRGDDVLIDTYVRAGFPVDVRTAQGYSALILAAYHGHEATVKQLIALGADPCARDRRGSSATMGAAFKGELSIVKLLLDQPCAKPDDRNGDGQTAAMYAALAGNAVLIDMLRERGANLTLQDAAGHTAASLARQQGAEDLAQRIELRQAR